jgi:hypothetical protein
MYSLYDTIYFVTGLWFFGEMQHNVSMTEPSEHVLMK